MRKIFFRDWQYEPELITWCWLIGFSGKVTESDRDFKYSAISWNKTTVFTTRILGLPRQLLQAQRLYLD